jgi:SRSO17 transposase
MTDNSLLNKIEEDHSLKLLKSKLSFHIMEYSHHFKNDTSDGHELSEAYIKGLFKTEHGKRNLERMNEEIELSGDSYQRIQHFITDSPWSAYNLIGAIAQNTSDLYEDQEGYQVRDVGYIVDESAHLKKGKMSAGVSRQYAGVIGKVDNCQVGVYSSLVWGSHSTLINERLFIPEEWIFDPERCDKAGIPENQRAFKTKPELALEMIEADLNAGIKFGWIGGDGLYGHGLDFEKSLDNMGLDFLLDIHCNQKIYLTEPILNVPEPISIRGRKPSKLKADIESVRVDDYAEICADHTWEDITIRNGTKGPLKLLVHTARVWLWDKESDKTIERTLVISRNQADNKIKFSLSNLKWLYTPTSRFAYMQAQRYWVERAFQEAKSELGMSDYQVRKWNAWHHHMALVMLSLSFLVKERILYKQEYPLLSARDIRLIIIAMLLNDPDNVDSRIAQLERRHQQRRKDIERRKNE